MLNFLKTKIKKYIHIWPVLYFFIYMPWFLYLENIYHAGYKGLHIIHCPLDDIMPFCEFFIVPYVLWFLYIPAVFLFMFYHSKNEFYRLCAYEFIGMTICLIIYSLYPNGIELRNNLSSIDRHNIFIEVVRFLRNNDTPTNVCPSIHVFATISAHLCLIKSPHMQYSKTRSKIKVGSLILTIAICLSTIFLQQHSIIDLLCGALLSFALYFLIFKVLFKNTTFPGPDKIEPDKHQVLLFLNKNK